jgi:hypothetical protein
MGKTLRKMKTPCHTLSPPQCAVGEPFGRVRREIHGQAVEKLRAILIIWSPSFYVVFTNRRDGPSASAGGYIVQKISVPVAKATVYVFAFAFWAFAMLLTYNLVGMVFRGHIEQNWFALIIFISGLAALYGTFARSLIKFGVPKAVSLFSPAEPGGTDEQTSNPLMTKEPLAMAKNGLIRFLRGWAVPEEVVNSILPVSVLPRAVTLS